jgi:hypothetical protein
MRRRSFLGVCLCSSTAGVVGVFGAMQNAIAAKPAGKKPAENKGGNQDPNGWIWSYVATKGDKEESGTFRVSNLQVFKEQKKVGHIDPAGGHKLGDSTVLILTDFGKLNGKATLEKSHKKPPVWAGTLKTEDGEWSFKAKLVEK